MWTCNACTFVNELSFQQCEICENPRILSGGFDSDVNLSADHDYKSHSQKSAKLTSLSNPQSRVGFENVSPTPSITENYINFPTSHSRAQLLLKKLKGRTSSPTSSEQMISSRTTTELATRNINPVKAVSLNLVKSENTDQPSSSTIEASKQDSSTPNEMYRKQCYNILEEIHTFSSLHHLVIVRPYLGALFLRIDNQTLKSLARSRNYSHSQTHL